MNGKKIQNPFQSLYVTKLKSWIRTELTTLYLTSDNKQYLNEYEALIHESALEDNRKMNRRWEEMKTNIAELVCEVLKRKQWGLFFDIAGHSHNDFIKNMHSPFNDIKMPIGDGIERARVKCGFQAAALQNTT